MKNRLEAGEALRNTLEVRRRERERTGTGTKGREPEGKERMRKEGRGV
jgi:hypothetical protein